MKKEYLYKYINVYCYYGTWQASYNDGKIHMGLHGMCCKTKKQAYEIAKQQVDYLNSRKATK